MKSKLHLDFTMLRKAMPRIWQSPVELLYRNLVVAPRTACVLPKANKAELDCWPQNPHLAIEDPFETHYDVAHVLKYPKHQLVRKEFMRASKLIDDAAAQRVDPDLVLDYICEPLPAPDQL